MKSVSPGTLRPLPSSPTAPAAALLPDSRMPEAFASLPAEAIQVLSPSAAAWPTRLSRLVILSVLLLVSVSPAPTVVHAAAGATASWAWPVPVPHPIARPFVAPQTAYGAGHRGIDISSTAGVVVSAPADGVVYFAGVVVDRPVLSIQHPDGLVSSYEPVESELAPGAPVRRGEAVGLLLPGHCATACLHFGVRLHGQYVSPLNYLGGIPHSVLLPTRPLARPLARPQAQPLARPQAQP
ncbi:M23 family metallopeptidase [Lacisediminihabitans sp. FW035]